ncbi:MAG: YfcE family phosphodiesterase [Desulfobacterales bacterium]|nr:YfcE family phosphodiesterase [Desulfobacterales bacterium]
MPQLIITGDIHGHLPTWKKIAAFLEPEDGLAVAGDLFDTVYTKPGGEYDPQAILDDIKAHRGPIWLVQGNCDDPDFHKAPLCQAFTFESTRFILAHGHKPLPDLTDYDVVIRGHSHVSQLECLMGKIFINPGSPIRPRGGHKGFIRFKGGILERVTLSGDVVDRLAL